MNKSQIGRKLLQCVTNSQRNINCTQNKSLFTGDKLSLSETKLFLNKFKSGEVRLNKKENGIAVLTINNPERRNAFSGIMKNIGLVIFKH